MLRGLHSHICEGGFQPLAFPGRLMATPVSVPVLPANWQADLAARGARRQLVQETVRLDEGVCTACTTQLAQQ